MPLLFSDVCDLLEDLERLETKNPPLLPADKADRVNNTTRAWFDRRRWMLDRLSAQECAALLSTLLPEWRPDRVYNLQATSLSKVAGRALGVGTSLMPELMAYKEPGRGDLGQCLERVRRLQGSLAIPKVQVKDVDDLLDFLAGQTRWSRPDVQERRAAVPSGSRDKVMSNMFNRLDPRESKWFIRCVLKDYSPVSMNGQVVFRSFHFLLPKLLRFQRDIPVACEELRTTLARFDSTCDPHTEEMYAAEASSLLKPRIGVKVDRPSFLKARSIKHCLNLIGPRSWWMERKYDGEYCEIHIDMSRPEADRIQIFSKNAKDATEDRKGILPTLTTCLRLDREDRAIREKAILLGELVVWSDATCSIMPFEEIRKHVLRSGLALGASGDDRPKPEEHLCIVFFDVLVLDDRQLLRESVVKRREVLKTIYDEIEGRAMRAKRRQIDFAQGEEAVHQLKLQFAASNALGCEGLVLKPVHSPYFHMGAERSDHWQGFVKLKKDYINGLGDEADFAVLGASYSAQEAAKIGRSSIKWTHFHLGAMLNKAEALRYGARPLYRLVGTIGAHMCIPPPVLETANRLAANAAAGRAHSTTAVGFDIEHGSRIQMSTVFTEPMVFEVLGSGFVKPPDCSFYMLRHPRVKKLHQDRSWEHCVGFAELQDLANKARTVSEESESQANRHELARLEQACRKRFQRMSKTPSPTKRHVPPSPKTPSPRKALGEISVNSISNTQKHNSTQHHKRQRHDMDSPRKRQKLNPEQASSQAKQGPGKAAGRPRELTDREFTELRDRYSGQDSQDLLASQDRDRCISMDCALSRVTLWYAEDVARTPYVTQDLSQGHAIHKVTDWEHWLRDESPPGEGEVAESQAYPGLRRIIIAEGHRSRALTRQVREILKHKDLGKTDIEIWDWRVLEEMHDHATILKDRADMLLGTITWSEGEAKMVYKTT